MIPSSPDLTMLYLGMASGDGIRNRIGSNFGSVYVRAPIMTKRELSISKRRAARTLRRALTPVGLAAGVVAAAFVTLPHDTPVVQAAVPAVGSLHARVAQAADTLEAPEAESGGEAGEAARAFIEGRASYYGDELAGRPTANGERFDPSGMTAAHPNLPFGTRLKVTNLRNGMSAVVRVNDRGPFVGRRIIDLSYAAARKIGMIRRGTARVRIEILK